MDVSPSICPHYHVNGGREGEEGHVATGETPHMLPSGVAFPPPPYFQPCLSVLNQSQHPPGPKFRGGDVPPPIQSLEKATGSSAVNKGGPHPRPRLPRLSLAPWPSAMAAPASPAPGPRLARWVLGCRQGMVGGVTAQGVGTEHPESISCLWVTAPLSGVDRR